MRAGSLVCARLLQQHDSVPVPRATRTPTRSAGPPGQDADLVHDCRAAQLAAVEEVGHRRRARTRELSHQCHARLSRQSGRLSVRPRNPTNRSPSIWSASRINQTRGFQPREQHRIGRYELLSTPFETIERNVRSQLAGMLSAGGFDPARDIEGITVNRWAHGYCVLVQPALRYRSTRRTTTSVTPTSALASVSDALPSRTPTRARAPCSNRRSNRLTAQSPK